MKMGGTRIRIAGVLLAVSLGLAAVAQAAEYSAPEPRAAVQKTIDEVLTVLRADGLNTEQRLGRIEKIAYARFDLRTMSRLILARNWKRFSEKQQEEYVREFKRYLANNYGSRIERYEQEEVEILGERQEPRGDVTVRTRIVGGNFENATVDYRMRKRGGDWKVIDVIIEGISLVSNFRDQFKAVLARGGPEHLLEQLREKNASGELATES
jgi:phospholipid transport system substrate-binding protein